MTANYSIKYSKLSKRQYITDWKVEKIILYQWLRLLLLFLGLAFTVAVTNTRAAAGFFLWIGFCFIQCFYPWNRVLVPFSLSVLWSFKNFIGIIVNMRCFCTHFLFPNLRWRQCWLWGLLWWGFIGTPFCSNRMIYSVKKVKIESNKINFISLLVSYGWIEKWGITNITLNFTFNVKW